MTTSETMRTTAEAPVPRDEEGAPLALLDACPDGGFFELDQWLPTAEQMKSAVRLNLKEAIYGSPAYRAALGPCPATSMRHGMGMIMAAALLAGALPFLINWIHGTQVGTVAPFLDPANLLATSQFFALSDNADAALFADAAQSIAGLEPWLPIWQAAGLSTLGHWLSWPLQWLAIWIVYGVAVLAVSHLFGAHTTLSTSSPAPAMPACRSCCWPLFPSRYWAAWLRWSLPSGRSSSMFLPWRPSQNLTSAAPSSACSRRASLWPCWGCWVWVRRFYPALRVTVF